MSDPSDELLLNIFGKELFTRWKELKGVKEFATNEQYFKWLNEVAEHYRLDYFFDDIVLMPYPVHTDEDSHHSKIIEDLCGAELYKEWKELRHEMKFATEVQYVEWLMDVGNHYILVTPRGRSCSDEEEEAWLSKVNTVENEIDNNWETVEDREKASTVCKEQSPKVTDEHVPVVKEETTLLSKQDYTVRLKKKKKKKKRDKRTQCERDMRQHKTVGNEHTVMRQNDGDMVFCKVCGDKAARVAYGVLTCRGCETFYYRNRLFNHNTFTCVKKKKCAVNVKQKKACAYCRFQKCLSVGMRVAGRVNLPEEVQCRVCGQRAIGRGREYGVAACRKCQDYFHRYLSELPTLKCSKEQNCAINRDDNTKSVPCKYCYLQKCTSVGMVPNKGQCNVCQNTRGVIYDGVPTCLACKAFFQVNNRIGLNTFTCVKEGNCVIDVKKKVKYCTYCRLKKCLSAGMVSAGEVEKRMLVKKGGKLRQKLSCKHCSHVCYRRHHLKEHLIYKHGCESKYSCETCGKYFVRRDKTMANHVETCRVGCKDLTANIIGL